MPAHTTDRPQSLYRPRIWEVKGDPTIWIDQTTGRGVTDEGTQVTPKIGARRKNPNLVDLVDTAANYGATRIMLTGPRPDPQPSTRHWLLTETPGWKAGLHDLRSPVTGRFDHIATGTHVELHMVEQWFGDIPLTPAQARDAWNLLSTVVKSLDKREPRLMRSPARTGANLWAMSLPSNLDPTPVSDDMAAELHFTSGQHHTEHLVAGSNYAEHDDCVPLIDPKRTPKITTFAHTDGRFMYAAQGREIGMGPGVRLNREKTWELLQSDSYARAWVCVRFRVPADWDHVGIFAVKGRHVSDGWFYPNRPGAEGETWADASEVHVALRHGWLIDPVESIVFKSARVLDTYFKRLKDARERIEQHPDLPPVAKRALEAALRAILIQSVGYFASSGRALTQTVDNAMDIPPEYQASAIRRGNAHQGYTFTYQVQREINAQERPFYHPEYAVQVWGRARAAVLDGASALGNMTTGALHVPGDTLLGVQGDAIYTTQTPRWALPTTHGGGDDGRYGRLRLKSSITGSFLTPETLHQREALRHRADRVGIREAITAMEGQT